MLKFPQMSIISLHFPLIKSTNVDHLELFMKPVGEIHLTMVSGLMKSGIVSLIVANFFIYLILSFKNFVSKLFFYLFFLFDHKLNYLSF